MDRMKTFGLYALCIILFFIFSNVMITIALKSSYDAIDSYVELPSNLQINITQAKATYVNGYVGGTLTNIGEEIEKTYMKIDLYSEREVLLGTRYIEFNSFKPNETKEFKMGFKLTDVDHAKISFVSEVGNEVNEEQFKNVELNVIVLLATVFILCYL